MSSTEIRLLVIPALLAALLAGCASTGGSRKALFDLPPSVAEEFEQQDNAVGEPPPAGDSADTVTEALADEDKADRGAAPIADADSAAVLQRLKAQTSTAVTARDADHEKQAQQARPAFGRAVLEMKKGNLDAALAQFRQLAAQYPALAGPVINQAIILRKKGQLDAAHKLLQDSLMQHGRNPYLLNELGVISRELGQFKKAQASYESAIRIDPNYGKAHYNLGVLADLYLHDPQLALQAFTRYQALQPQPDNTVDGWIKDLERRTAKGNP